MTASPSSEPSGTEVPVPEDQAAPEAQAPEATAGADAAEDQTPAEDASIDDDHAEDDHAEDDHAEDDHDEDDDLHTGEIESNPEAIPDAVTAEGDPAEAAPADDSSTEGRSDAKAEKPKKKKAAGPDPAAITRLIGRTSEAALEYVAKPDPKLARMARKHREAVISEIPPVTAGALLGPEALCRHFLASAASGRYVDLFHLWELFKVFPEDCKPVLASRQKAQEKARAKMRTATHLGLLGSADRVAADIDRAAGLPWRWLKEILEPMGPAINQRPAVLAAMLRRGEGFVPDIPAEPSDRWLAEAAALRDGDQEVPAEIDRMLAKYADRLPATLATLTMADEKYADRVPALIDRVDLGARDIGAIMAWARDHGHAEQLASRIAEDVRVAAESDRAAGLARWKAWKDRGVEVEMPESLASPTLEGLDLGRPESADLIKRMVDAGADMDPQQILDQIAADNRMLGEKAYEAFVCAGLEGIHLPLALEGNPMVRPETRCPACQAWTWVRPGHETRCPHDGMPLGSATDTGADVDAAVASLIAPTTEVGETLPGGERPASPPPATDVPDAPAAQDDWSAAAEDEAAQDEAAQDQAAQDQAAQDQAPPSPDQA